MAPVTPPATTVKKSGFWTMIAGGIATAAAFLTNSGVISALPPKVGGYVGGAGAILTILGTFVHINQTP
jgi:hypothetical protein